MLNDDSKASLGGIGNIIGQMGLGVGSSESNIDKIIELSRARAINQRALFQRDQIHNTEDYLANHLIHSLKDLNAWEDKSMFSFGADDGLDLQDFQFSHHAVDSFSILENKALKKIYAYLVGRDKTGGAFKSDYSELSGIMYFQLTTGNPELSIKLVNKLYDQLSAYYVETAAEKQRYEYNLVKNKYDSINTALKTTQYTLAKFEDQNRSLIKRRDALREKQLEGEEMKLVTMLGEAEKQLQIAHISLENKSAFIQLIDRPLLPLKPINKGRIYYFLLGGFLGGLFAIAFVVISTMYKEIMS